MKATFLVDVEWTDDRYWCLSCTQDGEPVTARSIRLYDAEAVLLDELCRSTGFAAGQIELHYTYRAD